MRKWSGNYGEDSHWKTFQLFSSLEYLWGPALECQRPTLRSITDGTFSAGWDLQDMGKAMKKWRFHPETMRIEATNMVVEWGYWSNGWLVVWKTSIWHFPRNIGWISSSQLTNSNLFQRGGPTTRRDCKDLQHGVKKKTRNFPCEMVL